MGITGRRLPETLPIAVLVAGCLLVDQGLDAQGRDGRGPFVIPLDSSVPSPSPRISREGTRIAYRAETPRAIYIRDIGSSSSRLVRGSIGNASDSGCFSPDGSQIAFRADAGSVLRRASVDDSGDQILLEGIRMYGFCDWAEDGYIYFATPVIGLMRVPESGGSAEVLVEWHSDADTSGYVRPERVPGSTKLLYGDQSPDYSRIMAVDLETGETTRIADGAEFIGYVSASADSRLGHLIFAREGMLFAGELSAVDLELGSIFSLFDQSWQISVSSSGTLVYPVAVSERMEPTLAWVDRTGNVTQIDAPAQEYRDLDIDPEGERAVISIFYQDTLTADLWIHEFDGNRQTRLTSGEIAHSAVWMPDGSSLIYGSQLDWSSPIGSLRELVAARGPRSQIQTLLSGVRLPVPTSVSPDGSLSLGSQSRADERGVFDGEDIWTFALNQAIPGDQLSYLMPSRFEKRHATFSPNGRWVAYSSDESSRREVWTVSFPDPSIRRQISTDGGGLPRWNPNGKELFYLSGSRLMSVEIQSEPEFQIGSPTVIFDDESLLSQSDESRMHGFPYDVAPDGQSFMVITPPIPPDLQIEVLRTTLGR